MGTSAVCSIFSASFLNATLGKREEKKMEREKEKKRKKPTQLIFHQCDSASKNHSKIMKARKAQIIRKIESVWKNNAR